MLSEGFARAAQKRSREMLLSQNVLMVGVFSSDTQLQCCRPHGSTGTRGILGAAESLPESTYLRGPGGYAETWAAIAVLLDPQSALMKKTRGQDFKESTLQIIRLTQ